MLIESPELHPEPEKPNEVSEPLDIEDEIKKQQEKAVEIDNQIDQLLSQKKDEAQKIVDNEKQKQEENRMSYKMAFYDQLDSMLSKEDE